MGFNYTNKFSRLDLHFHLQFFGVYNGDKIPIESTKSIASPRYDRSRWPGGAPGSQWLVSKISFFMKIRVYAREAKRRRYYSLVLVDPADGGAMADGLRSILYHGHLLPGNESFTQLPFVPGIISNFLCGMAYKSSEFLDDAEGHLQYLADQVGGHPGRQNIC